MLLLLHLILNSVGVRAQGLVYRIVGGEPVSILERPFQVTIYQSMPKGSIADCGGAILNSRWILTAAHCVCGVSPDHLVIRAGSDDLRSEIGSMWFKVERIVSHEKFDEDPFITSHDIALLKTAGKITFAPNIKPINVSTTPPKPLAEAIISGFGVTAEGDRNMSSILRQVSVTVLDRNKCLDLLAQILPSSVLSETHFCAAYLKGGKDACQGDSGGPITIGGCLAGVVSWGIGCAREHVPAFYTDVSQFIPWIDSVINNRSKPRRSRYQARVSRLAAANRRQVAVRSNKENK